MMYYLVVDAHCSNERCGGSRILHPGVFCSVRKALLPPTISDPITLSVSELTGFYSEPKKIRWTAILRSAHIPVQFGFVS